MPRLRSVLSLAFLLSLLSLPSFAAEAPAHPSRARLQPCKAQRDGEVDAFCGEYQVWENRQAKAGRKITLKVLVLPALGPNPKWDPVVALGGGPGQAASALIGILSDKERQDRDFLFVDQRGTGEPDRLQCLLGRPGDFQSLFEQLFPVDAVRRCRDELSRKYDLTLYTTAAGADDLDEVRAWLGYEKLNLAGFSYGTRMAQVYLKRHPESVRTVMLWGSIPMDEALPITHSAAGQRSLDLYFDLCERDAACRDRFPVRQDFQAMMARLDQGPVEVEASHPETGKRVKVRLPREVVAEVIRMALYNAQGAAAMLPVFHEAAAGNWQPLGEIVVERRYGFLNGLAQGLFFSVTCAEDRPYITQEQIAARTAGSFLRDDRVSGQNAACDVWPRATVEPGHREAGHTNLPVLALTGRFDTVTPPEFGRRTVASYPNSLFLEVPYESHAIGGDCPLAIARAFLDRGSLQGLDTSCLAEMKPAPFQLHLSRVHLQPCKVEGVDALCGLYEVWEDREAKAGRRIGLKVAVLPALAANPLPDPVFLFTGGPGSAATTAAGFMAGSPLRQERDIVLINERGSAEPDRLTCVLADREDELQSYLQEIFPLSPVRRCLGELGKKYDLTRYTLAAAVDDFDEIRRWLGYGKINVVGNSYGTRAAQMYLRRYPESVRTVTLWGVAPMDEPVGLSHSPNAQRSLDLLFDLCEKDAACRAKFPVRADFQAVMERLSRGPVEVEVADPENGKAARVRLSRDVMAEGIRLILYSSEASAALPLLLHQAAAGDWKPLGQAAIEGIAGLERMLTRGLFFSESCAEDVAFIDPAEMPARGAGSFVGDYRVRRLFAICELWPRARIDPAQRQAVRSDVPVLLVNGGLDPVTPPDFVRRASRFLTQGLALVNPYAGHEEAFDSCTEAIAAELVRRGTIEGLDTSCLGKAKPWPFLLEPSKAEVKPFG